MKRTEQAIQRAVVQHLEARGVPKMYWFAVPNGGWRSHAEAAIMQSMGVRAGVPDLCLIHNNKAYFLELKSDIGRVTAKQLEARDRINEAGGFVALAQGLDEALRVLETWGLLRVAKS